MADIQNAFLLAGGAGRRTGDYREASRLLTRDLGAERTTQSVGDDLAIVATELGTNAIRHTASGQGGWLVVEITWYGPVVRVTVGDNGGPTEPRVIDDPAAEHGRGLLLVRGLSLRTGVYGDHRGRLVWADLLWESTDPATQTATSDPHETAIRDGEAALARRFAGILSRGVTRAQVR